MHIPVHTFTSKRRHKKKHTHTKTHTAIHKTSVWNKDSSVEPLTDKRGKLQQQEERRIDIPIFPCLPGCPSTWSHITTPDVHKTNGSHAQNIEGERARVCVDGCVRMCAWVRMNLWDIDVSGFWRPLRKPWVVKQSCFSGWSRRKAIRRHFWLISSPKTSPKVFELFECGRWTEKEWEYVRTLVCLHGYGRNFPLASTHCNHCRCHWSFN